MCAITSRTAQPSQSDGAFHSSSVRLFAIVRVASRSARRPSTPSCAHRCPLVRSVSASRHLRPRQVAVDARLAGQAEDALAEDVAHDLRRAALDRVGARRAGTSCAPSRAAPSSAGFARAGGTCSRSRRCRPAPSSVDAQLVDRLVEARRTRAWRSSPPGPGLPARAFCAARMLVRRSTSASIHSFISRSRRAGAWSVGCASTM